jgi:undecaprenyl-diphosphatase
MSGFAPLGALPELLRRPAARFFEPRPLLGHATLSLPLFALMVLGLALIYLDPLSVDWQRGLPAGIVIPFRYITYLGLGGVILIPSGLAMLLLSLHDRIDLPRSVQSTIAALQVRLLLIFLAVGVPGLIATIGKRLIGRVRPPAFETHGHLAFEPIGWKAIAQGLPSGHATTAFAAAVVFSALWPRARTPLFVLAALIALSRVVIGSHYPTDVVAGTLLGALAAGLMVRAFAARRLALKVAANGRVEPMAGPSARRLAALAGAIRDAVRRRRPRKTAADESAG